MEKQTYTKKYPIVIFFGKLFSVFPIEYTNPYKKCSIQTIAILQLIIFLMSCVYCLTWKDTFLKFWIVEKISDNITHIFASICNIINVFTVVFFKHDEILEFLNSISTMDRFIEHTNRKKLFIKVSNGILISCLLMFIVEISYVLTIVGVNKDFLLNMTSRYIQFYQLSAMIMILSMIIKEMAYRFESLNDMLVNINHDISKGVSISSIKTSTELLRDLSSEEAENVIHCSCEILFQIRKYHSFLCDKVEECNRIFGIVLLFLILIITLSWLEATIFFVSIHALNHFKIEKLLPVSYNIGFVIFFGLFGIYGAMIQAIVLACSGENLSIETSRTSKVCCSLQTEYRFSRKFGADECYIKELAALTRQAAYRQPCISAAGFFILNHKVLGVMIANVTSYLLIVIQFLSQRYSKMANMNKE